MVKAFGFDLKVLKLFLGAVRVLEQFPTVPKDMLKHLDVLMKSSCQVTLPKHLNDLSCDASAFLW